MLVWSLLRFPTYGSGKVGKGDICAILPDVSPTTVEAVLGGMVREGRIAKLGTGRATKYLAARPA